jgi:hypothetical protein
VQEEDPRGPINEENLLEKGIENPKSLDSHELFELNNYINDNAHYEYYVKFINFSKPYDKLFAYGPNIINIKHPSGQDLLRFICYTIYKKLWENVSKESLGKLEDSIRVFLENSVQDYSQIVDFDYLTENEKNINYE